MVVKEVLGEEIRAAVVVQYEVNLTICKGPGLVAETVVVTATNMRGYVSNVTLLVDRSTSDRVQIEVTEAFREEEDVVVLVDRPTLDRV